MSMEGIYEYGSRAGVWRILREFEKRGLPLTVFGVGMALQRYPEADRRLHGTRPRDRLPRLALDPLPGRRRGHRARAHAPGHGDHRAAHRRARRWAGTPAATARSTRRLVADYGGFEYDSDYYGDDLPFWMKVRKTDGSVVPHLIVPYTLDCNDMRFALPQGYSHARPLLPVPARQLRRAVRRGRPEAAPEDDEHRHALPPARAARAHRRRCSAFSTTSQQHDRVWVCRRIDIARHWKQAHPFTERLTMALTLDQLNAAAAGEAARAARRPLRTLALDRRSGAGAAAVPLAGAPQARAWPSVVRRAPAGTRSSR